MSQIQNYEGVKNLVEGLKSEFLQTRTKEAKLVFEQESKFALQALDASRRYNYPMLYDTAIKNPDSLRNAIINVASVDLSLSPVSRLAYLVPRDGKVCLDISYMGFIQLAIDTGSIEFVRSEVVRDGDNFELNGMTQEPTFKINPFDRNRKNKMKVGVFCCAFIGGNKVLTDFMTYDECMDIKAVSKGAGSKYSPWQTFEDEMLKKTVLKRAYKLWPKLNTARIEKAIQVLDENEGFDLDARENEIEMATKKVDYKRKEELVNQLKEALSEKTKDLDTNKKGLFMLDFTGMKSFHDLANKKEDEIEIMISCVKTGVLFDKKKGELK